MDFSQSKNILVIRPDNMGDLLMSSPAIRAIKLSFRCKITVLCSSKASEVINLIPEIDDHIIFDLPWLKFDDPASHNINELIEKLKSYAFDGCILFNVYSQNPAPCLLLAYLAGIKNRAAYSRENLYGLLTHWLPDDEPLFAIQHQVDRDLKLTKFLGAKSTGNQIKISEKPLNQQLILLKKFGLLPKKYFILHTGVSEKKRQYPKENWVKLAQMIIDCYHMPIILTGLQSECVFTESLVKEIGDGAYTFAGKLDLNALTIIIKNAKGMISVNTGPMHLAVALKTPLLALYAQTNPQHTPFKTQHKLLQYSIPNHTKSLNQIIRFVNEKYYNVKAFPYPSSEEVMKQLNELIDEAEAALHVV